LNGEKWVDFVLFEEKIRVQGAGQKGLPMSIIILPNQAIVYHFLTQRGIGGQMDACPGQKLKYKFLFTLIVHVIYTFKIGRQISNH
jgi:hypothetical protein